MKQDLEPLRTSRLTYMEGGQLVNQTLGDMRTIEPTLLTDQPFIIYNRRLAEKADLFQLGLKQVKANVETQGLIKADGQRDKDVSAFNIALNLYALSDVPAEVEASRVLRILNTNYKNLPKLNYQSQTFGMDKLVSELESPEYSQYVTTLAMERYVVRMKNSNNTFKTLFSSRIGTTATTEVFDMKILSRDLLKEYKDFTNYVESMAKAHNMILFTLALDLINTSRKYYANILARRLSKKKGPEEPEA